ncbi:MAG TPA: histidine phosphatase family protein [Pseudonocardiaceae bacterium]|nr:histidine phosphatase family protein [Pseudonocardiaceae bacterium]
MASDEQPVIYVLRHGETEWSLTGRHTGRTDIPLTVEGEQQARRAGLVLSHLRGTHLPPALVLSSPRQRAQHTAGLAGLHVDEVTADLAEWDYGDYEGLTTEEIRQKVPDWSVWSHPIPGGETADQVTARANRLLDRVTAAMKRGDVILIGHGHFSRVLIAAWLGLSAAEGVQFGLDPAGTTVLGSERGERQVVRSNIPPWSADV